MTTRRFTPAQANRTLPLVKRIVADVLACGQELQRIAGEPGARGDEIVAAQFRDLQHRLRDLLAELESVGCSFRDWGFDKGLVDFPARIDGHDVLLCWRSDEERVEWYHLPDAGYAGRTPIPDELLEDGVD